MEEDDIDPASVPLYEAAAWRIHLAELSKASSPAFEAWLTSSPQNAEAWRQVQAMWLALESAGGRGEVLAYRQAAGRRLRSRQGLARSVLAAGGMAAAVCVLVGAAVAWERLDGWETISTPRAERRTLALKDGSHLTLDAGSRVRVRVDRRGREVELVGGQARFDVAHDTRRPFRVHADGRVVTALGTSFSVDRTQARVTVTLITGRVSVAEDMPPWRRAIPVRPRVATILSPGQRLSIPDQAPRAVRVERVSFDQATAWEAGRLVFDSEPLEAAIERVNRYGAGTVRVGDAAAGGVRVSGVFNAGDTHAFVEAVTQYFGLEAVTGPEGETILRSRRENSP